MERNEKLTETGKKIDENGTKCSGEKQGKILTIDTELESYHKKKSAGPLPGYYFANILMVADSEKELESILDSKCGRKRKNKTQLDVSQKKQKEQFCLEDSHLSRVLFRVKPGQLGDSMFVKNLSSAVFDDDVLTTSSVTGIKCKKDSVAKPALCPKQLDYIKRLFNETIDKEFPACPVEERSKRLNEVNAFIAEKIITQAKKE